MRSVRFRNLQNGDIFTLYAYAFMLRSPGERRAEGAGGERKPAQHGVLVLTDVGQALGVSPVYVTDVFRQVEGTPFYRYPSAQRLERAVRLLPGHQGDLAALALELDFANHSHFTTAFRRAFGCTPAAFREKARRVCGNFTSSASQRVETQNPSVAEHLARPVSA